MRDSLSHVSAGTEVVGARLVRDNTVSSRTEWSLVQRARTDPSTIVLLFKLLLELMLLLRNEPGLVPGQEPHSVPKRRPVDPASPVTIYWPPLAQA